MGAETITAKEISGHFVSFVTGIFMFPEGCSRPEVDEELIRLEGSGELRQAREDSRADIDALMDEIVSWPIESRPAMFLQIETRKLALVYDRIQCGTHSLIEMDKQGVRLPLSAMPPLPVLFRQILLQKLS